MLGNKFNGLYGFMSKNNWIVLKLFRCLQSRKWLSFLHNDGEVYVVNFHEPTGNSEAVNAQWASQWLLGMPWGCEGEDVVTLVVSFQNFTTDILINILVFSTIKYCRISNWHSLTNLKQKDSWITLRYAQPILSLKD